MRVSTRSQQRACTGPSKKVLLRCRHRRNWPSMRPTGARFARLYRAATTAAPRAAARARTRAATARRRSAAAAGHSNALMCDQALAPRVTACHGLQPTKGSTCVDLRCLRTQAQIGVPVHRAAAAVRLVVKAHTFTGRRRDLQEVQLLAAALPSGAGSTASAARPINPTADSPAADVAMQHATHLLDGMASEYGTVSEHSGRLSPDHMSPEHVSSPERMSLNADADADAGGGVSATRTAGTLQSSLALSNDVDAVLTMPPVGAPVPAATAVAALPPPVDTHSSGIGTGRMEDVGLESGRFVRLGGAGSGLTGAVEGDEAPGGGGLLGVAASDEAAPSAASSSSAPFVDAEGRHTYRARVVSHATPERDAHIPPMHETTPPSVRGDANPLASSSALPLVAERPLGDSEVSNSLPMSAAQRGRSLHASPPMSPPPPPSPPPPVRSASPKALPGGLATDTSRAPARPPSTAASGLRTSLHVLPSAASQPHSPTSSLGGLSSISRTGARTSLHAVPRGGAALRLGASGAFPTGGSGVFGSKYAPNEALAARVAEDQRLAKRGHGSSAALSVTSSVRRRARASLHVLPKRMPEEADPDTSTGLA